jgi:hypothetical protein
MHGANSMSLGFKASEHSACGIYYTAILASGDILRTGSWTFAEFVWLFLLLNGFSFCGW